jgi:hypothetical protein
MRKNNRPNVICHMTSLDVDIVSGMHGVELFDDTWFRTHIILLA